MKLGKFEGAEDGALDEADSAGTPLSCLIDLISSIIMSLLGILAGCGIIKGLVAF
mgnify:CR=1 FL=1